MFFCMTDATDGSMLAQLQCKTHKGTSLLGEKFVILRAEDLPTERFKDDAFFWQGAYCLVQFHVLPV